MGGLDKRVLLLVEGYIDVAGDKIKSMIIYSKEYSIDILTMDFEGNEVYSIFNYYSLKRMYDPAIVEAGRVEARGLRDYT